MVKSRRGFLGRVAILSVILASALIAARASANEPIHSAAQLNRPVAEKVVRVRTAKVVLADYALIRRDFVQVRGMSDAQIDEWLLQKTAFISRPQAAQSAVNTPIATSEELATALRPKDYGRALVYEVGPASFIDGKGAGSLEPVQAGHSNGLATLGEATREFLYEKLANTLLLHSGSHFDTVGHYAVIDWGFDVVQPDGKTDPAGMVLRQAHRRAPGRGSLLDDAAARDAELTFRRYGVTTTGAYRAGTVTEQINVQGTPDGALVDFGGFLTVENFFRPARNFYHTDTILSPGDIDFLQPDTRYRVPFDTWGYGVSGLEDPKFDNPSVWSHELATNFRRGIADRAAFQRHFDNMVGSFRRNLLELGGEADEGTMGLLVEALRDVH
jgi:hypothetical protein